MKTPRVNVKEQQQWGCCCSCESTTVHSKPNGRYSRVLNGSAFCRLYNLTCKRTKQFFASQTRKVKQMGDGLLFTKPTVAFNTREDAPWIWRTLLNVALQVTKQTTMILKKKQLWEGRGEGESGGTGVISSPHQCRTCQPDEGRARLGILPLVTAGPACHFNASSTDPDKTKSPNSCRFGFVCRR